jgi:hypothetical protein
MLSYNFADGCSAIGQGHFDDSETVGKNGLRSGAADICVQVDFATIESKAFD